MALITVDQLKEWGTIKSASTTTLALIIDAFDKMVYERYDIPATPTSDIVLAALMQCARWHKRSQSPEGVAGIGFDGSAIRVSNFDPDVKDLLSAYRAFRIG